ncbi:hypothetical protein [Streptomyces justiciae]|uniref:hypothetical protein n=1 Tax=Streptomyces justiciae TaxID=2780140 RepID=UPI0018800875|nr:hypothetical protein [Streptomyces justiciae]MBE8477474.1 hypothetical protein [Streptomyces justiciae]
MAEFLGQRGLLRWVGRLPYGITKSFADIMDLDAGILAIASGILNINGKEGIIAAPGKLLGNSPPKTSELTAENQTILPTDIYNPTRPATEQVGVKGTAADDDNQD